MLGIIYAVPFILLSLIAFAVCLTVPPFRPYAFRALVAPVAFGFCSIVGMALIVIASHILHLPFARGRMEGTEGVLVGFAVYVIPGVVGAWVAVEAVRQVGVRLLKTQPARGIRGWRALATRSFIALLVFGPAFLVCVGVQFRLFPRAEEYSFLGLVLSLAAAGLIATVAFLIAKALRGRVQAD